MNILIVEDDTALNNGIALSLNTDNTIQAFCIEDAKSKLDTSIDLVILDPPKFASSHHHVDKAARAYKDINLNGLRILTPGGQLLTFSCSGAIDVDLFQKIVAGAVIDSRVEAWMMERLGAGIDHPLLMTHPEGEYLKGLHLLSRGAV